MDQDGYLSAETNIISTWTLFIPELTTSAIIGTTATILVSALGILAISIFYFKKRR
jgi:hypothetical protein